MCDSLYPLESGLPLWEPSRRPTQRESTIYLRFPSADSPAFRHIKLVMTMFEGSTPVKIRLADTGKLLGTHCLNHPALLQECREWLGNENVVVKTENEQKLRPRRMAGLCYSRSVAGAVAAGGGVSILGHLQGAGREELPDGEGHVAEQAAGVLLVAAAALRLGDASHTPGSAAGCPAQPHQGELPQGHIEPAAAAIVKHQGSPKLLGDEGRGSPSGRSRSSGACSRSSARVSSTMGIHSLHHGGGQVGAHPAGDIQLADDGVGGEDFGAALAAEQDAALVKHAQALCLGARGRPGAHLQRHPIEKPHIDGVEPPVEGHRLHVGIDVQQLRRAAPTIWQPDSSSMADAVG